MPDTPDSVEILRRIDRLSSEAAWSTDELRETLRADGVDPDRLVAKVRAAIAQHGQLQPTGAAASAAADDPPQPLLVTLRHHTALPPSALAAALDVPVPFLAVVSRHPAAVPRRWRQEFARRAEQALHVAPDIVLASFTAPAQYARAASRHTPYTPDAVQTYTDLLDRADFSPQARHFWQALAEDDTA